MSHLPADIHKRLEDTFCSCFPGTCRGGQVIDGKLLNGKRCKACVPYSPPAKLRVVTPKREDPA